LRSFSSSLPTAAYVLAVLQVQQLTRVELDLAHFGMTDNAALSMALARLSNLQQLHLGPRAGNIVDASLGPH
jgi:hypothetical protein